VLSSLTSLLRSSSPLPSFVTLDIRDSTQGTDRQGAGFFVPFFYWKLATELPHIPFLPLWAGLFYQSFTRLHPFCLFICLYNFSLLLLNPPSPPRRRVTALLHPLNDVGKMFPGPGKRQLGRDAGVGISIKYQHLLCDRGSHSPPSSHYPSTRIEGGGLPGTRNNGQGEGGL
jgi:hypothetical protein